MGANCCYVLLPILVGLSLVIIADPSSVQYEYETDFNKPKMTYRYRGLPAESDDNFEVLHTKFQDNDKEVDGLIDNHGNNEKRKIFSDEESEDGESIDNDSRLAERDEEDEGFDEEGELGEKDEENIDEDDQAEESKLDDVNADVTADDSSQVPKTDMKRHNEARSLGFSKPVSKDVETKNEKEENFVRVDYDMETDVEQDDDVRDKVIEKRKGGSLKENIETTEAKSKRENVGESDTEKKRLSRQRVHVRDSTHEEDADEGSKDEESKAEGITDTLKREGESAVSSDEGENAFNKLSERVENLDHESLVDKILFRLDRETMHDANLETPEDSSVLATRILEEKRAEDVVSMKRVEAIVRSRVKKKATDEKMSLTVPNDEVTLKKREKKKADDTKLSVKEVEDFLEIQNEKKVADVRSALMDSVWSVGAKTSEVRSANENASPCDIPVADWGYGCENGPDKWIEAFPDCGGERQSPINIDTTTSRIDYEPVLKWRFYNNLPTKMDVINNGHTVMLTTSYDGCEKPTIFDSSTGREYIFAQLHFHWGPDDRTGSEHTINYKKYPLELHVVHFRRDFGTLEQAAIVPGGLAVVSILYLIGKHPNAGLSELECAFSKIRNAPNHIDVTPFPITHIVQPFAKNYITYNGSLTTPPCSETVTWFVYQKMQCATRRQLKKFREFKHDGTAILNNNRPTQPVNRRCIIQVA